MEITTAFSTAIILLLLAGCDPLAKETMDFYQNTKRIDLSGENINSISIHSVKKWMKRG